MCVDSDHICVRIVTMYASPRPSVRIVTMYASPSPSVRIVHAGFRVRHQSKMGSTRASGTMRSISVTCFSHGLVLPCVAPE